MSAPTPSRKPHLEIDGAAFEDLQGFFDEVSRKLVPGAEWGRNLDAFDDVLRGGFGTPEGGFVLHWRNSALSRARLAHQETVRVLERRLVTCHPLNVPFVREDLEAAHLGRGPTLFQTLVALICAHGPGGDEAEDGVELVLD
jgi:RNAse (barnase) inhibitor barstar